MCVVDEVWWWRKIYQRSHHDSYYEHTAVGAVAALALDGGDNVLCHSHCIVMLRIRYPCRSFAPLLMLSGEISLVLEDDPIGSHPFVDTDCDVVYPPVSWLLKSLGS